MFGILSLRINHVGLVGKDRLSRPGLLSSLPDKSPDYCFTEMSQELRYFSSGKTVLLEVLPTCSNLGWIFLVPCIHRPPGRKWKEFKTGTVGDLITA